MKTLNNLQIHLKGLIISISDQKERKLYVGELKGMRKNRIIISQQEIRDYKFELERIKERIKHAQEKIRGVRQEIRIISNLSLDVNV